MSYKHRCNRLFHATCVEGVELCDSEMQGYALGKHMHEEYQISLYTRGTGVLTCRGSRAHGGINCVALLSPGEVHSAECSDNEEWGLSNLYVSAAFVAKLGEQLDWRSGRLPWFTEPLVVDSTWWEDLRQLIGKLRSPEARLSLDTVLLCLLAKLFQQFAHQQLPARPGRLERRKMLECRAYLEAHYAEELTLATLTALVGMSEFQLIRDFKDSFGLPPHAFQIQLRLNKAKDDLRAGASLATVALKHGFYDQSHFHRHFKRSFGISPSSYRRMMQTS